jgi:hypothetical protein
MRSSSLKDTLEAPPTPNTQDGRRRVRFAVPDDPIPESLTLSTRPKWHPPLPLRRSAPAGPGASGPLPPRQLYPLPALQQEVLQSIEANAAAEKKKNLPTHKPAIWIPERANNRSVEHLPGTAAYYSSKTFKDVVAAGKDQVSGSPIKKPKVSIMPVSRKARTHSDLYQIKTSSSEGEDER